MTAHTTTTVEHAADLAALSRAIQAIGNRLATGAIDPAAMTTAGQDVARLASVAALRAEDMLSLLIEAA